MATDKKELMQQNDRSQAMQSTNFSAINIPVREEFIQNLNTKPEQVTRENGVDTVPISHLETTLDEVYFGLWETENFRFQVIANEIVGTIDLKVFDPQMRVWIKRSGSAAVMIRQKKDASITDIGAKIKNGLSMDFPKLESMCLKAAAKRLGKKFGRDLNRKFEDEYEPVNTYDIELDAIKDKLEAKLNACTNLAQLVEVWNAHEVMHDNPKMKKLFNSYKLKLQYSSANKQ